MIAHEEMDPWWRPLGERMQRRWGRRPLPWYAQEKAGDGAFAAFVGIQFVESGPEALHWNCVALGDACLIHKPSNGMMSSRPIDDPRGFGYHPVLIPSDPAKQVGIAEKVHVSAGRAEPGDTFLLLTDAIACWYLQACVDGSFQAEQLEQVVGVDDRRAAIGLIGAERESGRLRNDDVAVVRLDISRDDGPPWKVDV